MQDYRSPDRDPGAASHCEAGRCESPVVVTGPPNEDRGIVAAGVQPLEAVEERLEPPARVTAQLRHASPTIATEHDDLLSPANP
jgi:hypothetical protein